MGWPSLFVATLLALSSSVTTACRSRSARETAASSRAISSSASAARAVRSAASALRLEADALARASFALSRATFNATSAAKPPTTPLTAARISQGRAAAVHAANFFDGSDQAEHRLVCTASSGVRADSAGSPRPELASGPNGPPVTHGPTSSRSAAPNAWSGGSGLPRATTLSTGRPLDPEAANGTPDSVRPGVVAAGFSLRQASAVPGMPRSSLWDHAAPALAQKRSDALVEPSFAPVRREPPASDAPKAYGPVASRVRVAAPVGWLVRRSRVLRRPRAPRR